MNIQHINIIQYIDKNDFESIEKSKSRNARKLTMNILPFFLFIFFFNTWLINVGKWEMWIRIKSDKKIFHFFFSLRLYTNNFWNVMSFLIFHISETHNLRMIAGTNSERNSEAKEEDFAFISCNFYCNRNECAQNNGQRKNANGDAKITKTSTYFCERTATAAAAASISLSSSRIFLFAVSCLSHRNIQWNSIFSLFLQYVRILTPFMFSNVISDCNFRECLCVCARERGNERQTRRERENVFAAELAIPNIKC